MPGWSGQAVVLQQGEWTERMLLSAVIPLLASHGITSFGPAVLRVLLSAAGAAAILLLAPVFRAMYAGNVADDRGIRFVEALAIVLLVALAAFAGLAIWDATTSLS